MVNPKAVVADISHRVGRYILQICLIQGEAVAIRHRQVGNDIVEISLLVLRRPIGPNRLIVIKQSGDRKKPERIYLKAPKVILRIPLPY